MSAESDVEGGATRFGAGGDGETEGAVPGRVPAAIAVSEGSIGVAGVGGEPGLSVDLHL